MFLTASRHFQQSRLQRQQDTYKGKLLFYSRQSSKTGLTQIKAELVGILVIQICLLKKRKEEIKKIAKENFSKKILCMLSAVTDSSNLHLTDEVLKLYQKKHFEVEKGFPFFFYFFTKFYFFPRIILGHLS